MEGTNTLISNRVPFVEECRRGAVNQRTEVQMTSVVGILDIEDSVV